MSILIVDDNPHICITLRDIFKVSGFQIEIASSGLEALEIFSVEKIECVLTDIIMPFMNGVELYKKLKQIRSDIPVVMMTGYSNNDLVEEGICEGVLEVLTKPLDIDYLVQRISAITNHSNNNHK